MLEDVETLVKQNLQAVLSEVQYDSERVGTWTNQVIDSCLRGLQAMGKSYKYIVTCILLQKNGAGLHTAAGAYWDGKKDGACGGERCGARWGWQDGAATFARRRYGTPRLRVAATPLCVHSRFHPFSPPLLGSRRHLQGSMGERVDALHRDDLWPRHCAVAAGHPPTRSGLRYGVWV